MTIEIHDFDCRCSTCEPYHPSHAPRLTAGDIGKLGLTGLAAGVAAGAALDPAGFAHKVAGWLWMAGLFS